MNKNKTLKSKPRFPRFRYFLVRIKEQWPYLLLLAMVITLIALVLWRHVFIIIHAGEGGVLYQPLRGGTVTERVYNEGLHILFPWNIMTRYNARVQVIKHEFSVLTNGGLPIELKVSVRYRPIFELLGILHQEVGPDYPQMVILPQIESVLRKGLGNHTPEEVYTNKDELLNELISQAIEEVGRKYITVDEIIIRSVSLPTEVRNAIEEKLMEEQRHLTYQYRIRRERKEAERKRIESAGIRDYARNVAATMDERVLRWQGIQATLELAKSENAKVVVIGAGDQGLPLILGNGWQNTAIPSRPDSGNDSNNNLTNEANSPENPQNTEQSSATNTNPSLSLRQSTASSQNQR